MKQVISCSRRTDIPACHHDWLQHVLQTGHVHQTNPYSGATYRVDLHPEAVHSLVLWSKNFGPLLKDPGCLRHYRLFFQFTITDLGKPLEPGVPPTDRALEQMRQLAQTFGPDSVQWRFDPLIAVRDRCTGKEIQTLHHRVASFRKLAPIVASCGIQRCTLSFAAPYRKVVRRLRTSGLEFGPLTDAEKTETTEAILDAARGVGMRIEACSDSWLSSVPGVHTAACIDGKRLSRLFGERASLARDRGQRTSCHCTRSRDIGSYAMTCGHGCLYCYAQNGEPKKDVRGNQACQGGDAEPSST